MGEWVLFALLGVVFIAMGTSRGVQRTVGKRERVFLALLGVVCVALGAHWISTNRYLVQHGVRTTGVVVDYRSFNHHTTTYYPQVRYVGPGNDTYVVEGGGSPTPQFRVGESVTVYYDPLDPETALVYGTDTDSGPWLFIGGGCVLLVVTIPWPLLWRLLRQRRCAAYRRRMLKLLHRLGGASLVWDASKGGFFSLSYRSSDGTWHDLKIAGLHLQDTAGNRVPFRAAPLRVRVTTLQSPAPFSARDCEHEAKKIAQHYSTEPGHYVLALPKGTVLNAPPHRDTQTVSDAAR